MNVEQITKADRLRVSHYSQNQANPVPRYGGLIPPLSGKSIANESRFVVWSG